MDGHRVSRGGGTVNWGVREAVDLSVHSLEVLQVQGDFALSALEAPFVEVLVRSLDILKGVHSLLANVTLGVGHGCLQRQKMQTNDLRSPSASVFGTLSEQEVVFLCIFY